MLEPTIQSAIRPLVFNSADWDLVQTQPFWHSFHYDWEAGRQIKARLTERGNVWEIGLWLDAYEAVEVAWDAEVDRRLQEVLDGTAELVSGEESMRKLDALLTAVG